MGSRGLFSDLPELMWSDDTYTLKEICQGLESPTLIKLPGDTPHLNLGDLVEKDRPFLAYSRRRRTKLYGENLTWNAVRKQYVPTGPVLEIPKDYAGWFDVVRAGEDAPRHHLSIESVAGTGCKHFLVCSTLAGFKCSEGTDELKITAEIRVYPGEVIQVIGIVTKTWKVKDDKVKISKKPSTIFLKCIDGKKRDIYLPYAHPGKFCAIHENERDDHNVVYQAGDLLQFDFPILVRLVFGWPPPTFSEFTGFIRLVGINRPDSLVLYNIVPNRSVVLEVPTDIDCQWSKAENEDGLKLSADFKKVMENCCNKVFPYLITMKCLDVRYFRISKTSQASQEREEEAVTESETDQKQRKTGRMARPVDMDSFITTDVYPKLTRETKVSDSWSFSFKDPDYVYGHNGQVAEENAVWVDIEEGELKPMRSKHNGNKKRKSKAMRPESFAGEAGAFQQMSLQETIASPEREWTGTVRESRERDVMFREANC